MKWYHNSYSEEAIAEMQKEAEDRVRMMQSRARLVGDSEPFFQKPQPTKKSPPLQTEQNQNPFPINLNSDSLIILALLWILWNEKADQKLILALLYILLQ